MDVLTSVLDQMIIVWLLLYRIKYIVGPVIIIKLDGVGPVDNRPSTN